MTNNQFDPFRGNPNLKRVGQPINWTPDLIEELIRCENDPIYFGENHFTIVTGEGKTTIPIRDYQQELILSCVNNSHTIAEMSRQSGKCLKGDTFINIRNKKTGEFKRISIEDFYNLCKKQLNAKSAK